MTDREDKQIQVLFDAARQALPDAGFAAGVARALDRHERTGRVLALAQAAALLGLLLPLSLFVEERLLAWFPAGVGAAVSAPGSWWLAGCIVGVSLLLSPRLAPAA